MEALKPSHGVRNGSSDIARKEMAAGPDDSKGKELPEYIYFGMNKIRSKFHLLSDIDQQDQITSSFNSHGKRYKTNHAFILQRHQPPKAPMPLT